MSKKNREKKNNDNKTTNKKSANPITLKTDPDMKEPVKGMPEI
ncbi:hypothetical protein SAMN02745207_02103 [Clostridium grantii DSM 8605]|uniref:Uncharacterized protein n=1 Tax=Clostridium grantii DSM 8605 TaxID=1121316 RepID=A0A1M5V6P2_9CLOT|nr:hypothetical protein SAMN02745207_02103 [Clostridium grantii DSM 8605]